MRSRLFSRRNRSEPSGAWARKPRTEKTYDFEKFTSGIAEEADSKKKTSSSWKSTTKFNEDPNGDIDPIQMDITDSKFLFDNEDAIVYNLKKGNSDE